MKPTLDCHEIMIVHNYIYNASFARVPQNKVSFSVRVWNPMNQIFLCLPKAIGTMINEDREKYAMVIYIVMSGKLTISNYTKNIPIDDVKFAAPPVREINLNFGTGAAESTL